jgi:hypothetical protein
MFGFSLGLLQRLVEHALSQYGIQLSLIHAKDLCTRFAETGELRMQFCLYSETVLLCPKFY